MSVSIPRSMKLESKLVLLRCYAPADAGVLAHALMDNADRLKDDFSARLEEAKNIQCVEMYIGRKIQQWGSADEFRFGVWDKATLKFAGEVVLKDIAWNIPKADVGYFVVQEFSGGGRVTDALRLIIPFAFETLHLRKLQIRTASSNLPSQRVAERCAFKREGILRNDSVKADGITLLDLVYYGLTLDDYEEMKRKPHSI